MDLQELEDTSDQDRGFGYIEYDPQNDCAVAGRMSETQTGKDDRVKVVEGECELMDTTLEARVARHLLKFDQLSEVWLGYQAWAPI